MIELKSRRNGSSRRKIDSVVEFKTSVNVKSKVGIGIGSDCLVKGFIVCTSEEIITN